jgi:porin
VRKIAINIMHDIQRHWRTRLASVLGASAIILSGRAAGAAEDAVDGTAPTVAATNAPAATNTPAAQPSKLVSFLMQDYLLGDWDGGRTYLSHHGVDFEFFYIGSLPSNLSGGLKTGSVYDGLFAMLLDLNSEKLGLYDGGQLHVSSLWINGHPFSANYVGDLNRVNLVDLPHAFRLWELWYQQKMFDDTLSLKFGEMGVDQDFIVADYSKTFINQTFFYPTLAFDIVDQPGFPVGNHGLPSVPYSAPGALVRWDPDPKVYAQAAIYAGNPDTTYSGTQFRINEGEGALIYAETGFRFNQGTNDTGLKGSYKAGGYYHTANFVDVYDATTGALYAGAGIPTAPPGEHRGNYGLYLLAEQQLYREVAGPDPAQKGLGAFFRIETAPQDRNLADFGIDGGLVYKGLIPSRDYDSLGIAGSYLRISDDIRTAQSDFNAAFGTTLPVADYEAVLEVTYKAQLAAWWTLQPTIERVWHPGANLTANIPNATVFIMQTTLRF